MVDRKTGEPVSPARVVKDFTRAVLGREGVEFNIIRAAALFADAFFYIHMGRGPAEFHLKNATKNVSKFGLDEASIQRARKEAADIFSRYIETLGGRSPDTMIDFTTGAVQQVLDGRGKVQKKEESTTLPETTQPPLRPLTLTIRVDPTHDYSHFPMLAQRLRRNRALMESLGEARVDRLIYYASALVEGQEVPITQIEEDKLSIETVRKSVRNLLNRYHSREKARGN